MTRCPAYWQLYRALCAACRPLSEADGDAEACAAIAAAERDNEQRRDAVEAIRMHNRNCQECSKPLTVFL